VFTLWWFWVALLGKVSPYFRSVITKTCRDERVAEMAAVCIAGRGGSVASFAAVTAVGRRGDGMSLPALTQATDSCHRIGPGVGEIVSRTLQEDQL